MSSLLDLIPAVVAEAQGARAVLAADLANAFVRTPDCFDPKDLERLGRDGLGIFLTSIGHSALAVGAAAPTRAEGSTRPPRQAWKDGSIGRTDHRSQGWSDLHRQETPYWLTGLLAGLRTGALLIAAGVTAFALVDDGLPFLREVLS